MTRCSSTLPLHKHTCACLLIRCRYIDLVLLYLWRHTCERSARYVSRSCSWVHDIQFRALRNTLPGRDPGTLILQPPGNHLHLKHPRHLRSNGISSCPLPRNYNATLRLVATMSRSVYWCTHTQKYIHIRLREHECSPCSSMNNSDVCCGHDYEGLRQNCKTNRSVHISGLHLSSFPSSLQLDCTFLFLLLFFSHQFSSSFYLKSITDYSALRGLGLLLSPPPLR